METDETGNTIDKFGSIMITKAENNEINQNILENNTNTYQNGDKNNLIESEASPKEKDKILEDQEKGKEKDGKEDEEKKPDDPDDPDRSKSSCDYIYQ